MKLVPGMGLNGSNPASSASELPAAKALGKTAALGASGFLAAIRTAVPAERQPDRAPNASPSASVAAKLPAQAAAGTTADAVHGVRRDRPVAAQENSVRVAPQRAEIRGEAAGRRMEDGVAAASAGIDWPWLAIATGSLSHGAASASVTASVPTSPVIAGAEQARPASPASSAPRLDHPTIPDAEPPRVSAPFLASTSISVSVQGRTAQDVDTAQGTPDVSHWSWPAEVRELIERRRLQIVDEGGGTVRLLARDFHLDPVAIDRWAASIHRELHAGGHSIRVLWINGRHYEFPQGEPHDR